MRRLPLLTTFAVLALPVVAHAADYEATGGGFGHGVGLSQYGAYGMAKDGRSHERILAHYYRDTELGTVRGERVRVLLQASRPGPASFSNARRAGGEELDPSSTYTVEPVGGSELTVRSQAAVCDELDEELERPRMKRLNERERREARRELRAEQRQRAELEERCVKSFDAPLTVWGDENQLVLGGEAINDVVDGRYRGRLELRPGASGGMTAVNDVALDDYVRGVIPAEMPSSWHPEALRAQAVAARSYAIATVAGGGVFDQYPDTRSQVYDGVGAEQPSTNRATRATAGQVVRHDGEVARTYFSSSSGGHTEDNENVFGGAPEPYLRGVPDPHDEISPRHTWQYSFSREELERRLGSWVKGTFRRIKVLERGASPRIVRAEVLGTDGATEVDRRELQARLETPDTPTRVERVYDAAEEAARVRDPLQPASGPKG